MPAAFRPARIPVIVLAIAAPPAAGQIPPSVVVARTGQQAPGAPGAQFGSFLGPQVNAAGQVAFSASLTGGGVTTANNQGVWAGTATGYGLVARAGSGGPDGATFTSFGANVRLAPDGRVVLTPSTGDGRGGVFAGPAGGLATVARGGDPAPGLTGVNYGSSFAFQNPTGNGTGQVAFTASLSSAGSTPGLFAGAPGDLQLVARIGDQAPGRPGGSTFQNFFSAPQLDGAGGVAFSGSFTGPSLGINSSGVWYGRPGEVAAVALAGDQAAGLADGVRYGTVAAPAVNPGGVLAFGGSVTAATGVTGANDGAIWAGRPNEVALVAREGDFAPDGAGSGTALRYGQLNFSGSGRLSDDGAVAFTGELVGGGVTGGDNYGVWAGAAGAVRQIAREGDRAPGTGPGVRFDGWEVGPGAGGFAPQVQVADGGVVAFVAPVVGDGVTNANDYGLWAGTADRLSLVAREGQQVDLGDGVLRTISGSSIQFGGGFFQLGQSGLLAWRASFTDGTQAVFVTPVPEPSGVLAAAAVGLLVARRAVRRR